MVAHARLRAPPRGASLRYDKRTGRYHDDPVTALADAVLPLVRTRADVWRWNIANAHGARMHEAVAILRQAAEDDDPGEVFAVTQRTIASALKVIMRADDSSGIIGDACRDLLDLHPILAAQARPATSKLVDWMLKFQFDNECDYFTIDPVAYAPALGTDGMASYRVRLDEHAAALGPRPPEDQRWSSPLSGGWFTLDWNAQRLAVFDRDVDAIIRTHARDRRVAAWLMDTATALMEIGEVDAAIDWAKQATDFDDGHQARRAADYWCELLAEHRPNELLDARVEIFRRWPSSTTAGCLYRDAHSAWPDYEDEVLERLTPHPRDAVLFAQLSLKDIPFAWDLARTLGLDDHRTWSDLAKAYEKLDPIAVLPVYTRLVEGELTDADARHYRSAARRLKKMRKLAAGSSESAEVDELIADLRGRYRRRPRLQLEFDRAGLP
jgi:tetratricopeptide (TPR) repeat protein